MKRISSFLLLLKQGLKGVFKFKIQFIIILLLSFLASFILSTSLTLTSRINKTYNNIVNNVDKFDYSSTNEIRSYRTDRNNSTTDRSVIPLLDLVNNSNSYYNLNSNSKNTSYLNFILNKKNLTKDFDNKTILTELFENKEFVELFTTINGNDVNWIWERNWLWQLALYFNKFVYHSYDQFLKNNSNYSYLKNTIIGKYLTNSFKDKNEFLNDAKVLDNVKYENIKNNFNAKEFRKTFNEQIVNKELFSYFYISGMSLFQYIYRSVYLPYFSEQNSDKKGNNFYVFLTGNKIDNIDVTKSKNWIISDNNKPYLTEFESNKTIVNQNENSVLVLKNDNDHDIKKLVLEKGLKGNTELVLTTIDNNKKVQAINPIINDTSLFKLLFYNGNGTSLTNVITVLSDTEFIKKDFIIGENQFDNIDLFHNIWLAHLKYTAIASGYDINFRSEVFNYDSVTQIRYRLVVLNNDHTTNLTILNKNQGARSPSKGEALISKQFARSHNLKLGQQIIVDGSLLTIVGFATDTYSFFPTTDPDFPIPQSQLGAILYVSRSTLKDLLGATSQSNTNRISKGYLSFFLRKKQANASIDMFNAYQLNDVSKLYDFIKYQKDQKNKVYSWINIKDFDHSIFRFNWTIAPLAINSYKTATLIAALVVSLIAIIALVICIRKTIYFNAKQIGILKALGSSPLQISISYLAYVLVIILTSVPLGWIIGLSTQSVFVKLFVNYFSIPLYSFTIEPFSLLISLLIFGVFGIIVSLLTAIIITKQQLSEILAVKQNWSSSKFINRLKRTWFKKAKFTTKFSLTLASSGKKNIFLLVTVVGISTMFISAGLAIPSIAFTIKNTYYKSIKYANEYNYAKGVSNSPLTKPTINYWNGQKQLDESILSTNLNNEELFYYKDPTAYASSSYDVNPFPKYLYKVEKFKNNKNQDLINKKIAWTLLELIQNKDQSTSSNHTNGLDLLFTEMFGNNLYNVVGNQFSIGVIDQILGIILNSKNNVINENDKTTKWTDEQKDLIFKELTNNFTKTGTTAISILVNDLSQSNSADWKTKIFDAILKATPPYVSAYIQQPSRKEQFSIGYNVQHYIPNHETLTTVSDINANINQKNTNLVLTGIANNQSAFIINQKNANNLFVDYKKLLALQEVFLEKKNTDIKLNDQFVLYDSKTNTINVPVLPNKQANAFYRLNNNTNILDISTSSKQFFIDTKNGYVNIPKHAWIYDDLNFVNSKYYKSLTDQQKQLISKNRTGRNSKAVVNEDIRWLDPYNLDNNKFTLKLLYEQDKYDNDSSYDKKDWDLLNNSYLFDDFTYNNDFDDLISSYIRPYYEYKNILLYIPQSLINLDHIIHQIGSKKSKDLLNNNSEQWYKKDIEYNKVPKSVLKAWNITNNNEKFLMIRPYDLRYTLPIENVYKSGLSNLTAKPEYWMYQATKTNNTNGLNAVIIQKDAKVKYQNKDLKITAKPIGILDSYNQQLILADQGLMNLVLNLSIGKKIGIKDNFYNKETIIKAGEKYNNIVSRFDRYDYNQINNYIDKTNNSKEFNNLLFSTNKPFYQAQFLWHNSKYSNIEEALDLTSGISFIPDNAYNGFYILNGNGASSASGSDDMISSIRYQNLLATSKTLINQITFIAISIGMLLIITVITTSALLVMLISDIYVTQYQQFMILMKALGYSNYKISKYAFGTAIVFSLIIWALSTAITWILITLIIQIITSLGFAIPYGFSIWTLIVSFIIVAISFIGSLIVSSNKIRTQKPASLLTVSNE